ncbi:acylphosphatase [Halorhodospira halochloris]|uniref:acylphosphatase n=1 Tax=Halorhodospira halochloris TaxID=1052 RepID=UPI001EE81C94|nr:acylphosphatase [Halorhodospira halochloris]MCG5531435.1 acylphosphatase [Halorhodospira halochloris]
MAESLHCYVSGLVQGVCFRAYTQEKARQLGLSGYVRNLADGRVEVLASGDSAQLAELCQWLHQGPPAARVEQVDCQQSEEQPSGGFVVK